MDPGCENFSGKLRQQLGQNAPNLGTIFEPTPVQSDGKNAYMCFQCCFILCAECMLLHFGKNSIVEEGNVSVEIGDEVLKLPPSYEEGCLLQQQAWNSQATFNPLEEPPSYDGCTAV